MRLTFGFLIAFAYLFTAVCNGQRQAPSTVNGWIDERMEQIVDEYRWFHSHPELSFEEKATAQRIAASW